MIVLLASLIIFRYMHLSVENDLILFNSRFYARNDKEITSLALLTLIIRDLS
jgi:hypothetical protein